MARIYALVQNGSVSAYPFSFNQLRLRHPDVSFPREPTDEILSQYGVYPVTLVSKPAASDPITKDVVEVNPTLVNGVWTQTWGEVNVSAEEATKRQNLVTDDADRASLKADSFVKQFIAMTPAQLMTYIDNNTANLAEVRTLLKRLAVMQLLRSRQDFR